MTGVALNTIQKLLADLGKACTEYQDKAMRNLTCKHIQSDEIWQFCYAKDKNVPADKQGASSGMEAFGLGLLWTLTRNWFLAGVHWNARSGYSIRVRP